MMTAPPTILPATGSACTKCDAPMATTVYPDLRGNATRVWGVCMWCDEHYQRVDQAHQAYWHLGAAECACGDLAYTAWDGTMWCENQPNGSRVRIYYDHAVTVD